MWGEDVAVLPQAVATITAPAVMGGIINHVGTHGVEFDVALAGEQVVFGLDE